jgi:hypothetical protein
MPLATPLIARAQSEASIAARPDASESAKGRLAGLPFFFIADRAPLETLIVFLAAAVLLQAWILARLWAELRRARKLVRAQEARVAAGEELEELRHMGYYVFHDVPSATQGENLDHIVVGPAGVFAVSAKARSGRGANHDMDAWEVTYDGEKLQFPGWEETLPLGQAIAKADWLFEWLYDELGEPVPVRPILVLPGWSVKRTAVSGIPVLAAHRIQAYFERMRALPVMGEGMIERIAERLDQRCRVVAVGPPLSVESDVRFIPQSSNR